MSALYFTQEQQNLLAQNPYITKVTDKSITYSDQFKIHAINEYAAGKTPAEMFKEGKAGLMGEKRIENTYENLLDTTFDCTEPTTIFHTDITYIKYAHGCKTAYLSAVKDEATREITAHATSESLEMPFVISTLEGLKMFNISSTAIIHSDQGVHYTSNSYKDKIQELGLKGSMSRRGKCVDNAPIESFFGHMKDEVNFNKLETYEEVVEVINSYIYKYNYLRPQWTLKKMTPVKYRNHLLNIA